jgi:hypothetical protein
VEAAEVDDPMTKTDFSVLATPKLQAGSAASTGGLMGGDGAFLTYLGQETAKKQPRASFPTSHAAYPQTIVASLDLADGMIRIENLESGQSGADAFPMPQWQAIFDQQANGINPATPQVVEPDIANPATEPAVQTDAPMADADTFQLSPETPAPFEIDSPTNRSTIVQQSVAPDGSWLSLTAGTNALTSHFQQANALVEQTLEHAAVNPFHHGPRSLPLAQNLEQTSPKIIQPHAAPANDSTSMPTATLPSTFAFKTSELVPSDSDKPQAQQTNGLPRRADKNAIDTSAAVALTGPRTGLAGEFAAIGLPAEVDAVTSTKVTGLANIKYEESLTPSIDSRTTRLQPYAEKAQQNTTQIAPQLAQSAPTPETEIPKPQRARLRADVIFTPFKSEIQDPVAPPAQAPDLKVRTLLHLSPQQTAAIQNAPPVTQSEADKHSHETAVNNTSIASAKNPEALLVPIAEASDLAQYSEKKPLYGNVFTSTGFSTSTSTSPTVQTSGVQPNAVPVSAIAEQIKTHSALGKPSTIELTLTPEDLGKIRLVMVPEGNKIRIVVHTDRPETLDLIRRNTDAFSADLRQAGYSSASFSFGGSNGREADHQGQPGSGPNYELPVDDADPSPAKTKPPAVQPKLGSLNLRV